MPMFSMFVASPPAGIRVNDIYREKFAFGPFGSLLGTFLRNYQGFGRLYGWKSLNPRRSFIHYVSSVKGPFQLLVYSAVFHPMPRILPL